MQITDPIADLLTRIRNASTAKHPSVEIPASNMKKAICQILVDEGYIKGMQVKNDTVQGTIVVTLKYQANVTVIRGWKLEFRLPLGPLTATVCAASSTVTVTPAGMTMGFLPILDIVFYPFLTTRRPGLRRRRAQHVQPCQS